MASKISQVTTILTGTHVMNAAMGYHDARLCVNALRMATKDRAFSAIRKATKNYRVMVSMVDTGIRLWRPDTRQELILLYA